MSIAAPNASVLIEDQDVARRERARMRLYVFCQCGGWLGFLGLCLLVVFGLSSKGTMEERICGAAIYGMVTAQGWLLTHFSRRFIQRWNWKLLGWRALVTRVLGISMVLSAIWTITGYGYTHGVLRFPWPDRISPVVALATTWLNGAILFIGWYCVYFIYHLFDRYNRLQIEQLRLATHVKEAELRALKSQINPHFIFNALNSLRALIDENPARARQAVTQLANLLRYSLQSAQAETVPFESELHVVADYLALEQVRYEDRLRVRLEIAPETLALAVPPLLLQTLVENAVKYGISERPEGGEILIAARCESGQLHLSVTNPGTLDPKARPGRGSTGLGLKNAAERMRLFFGDQASLSLRSVDPSLVIAEVSLPVQMTRA
jgi:hypothetical protein